MAAPTREPGRGQTDGAGLAPGGRLVLSGVGTRSELRTIPQAAAELPVRYIAHRWAGLRSFVADDKPVNGYAPDVPGLYWLVGQGGFGVQTSPTMARIARQLVLGLDLPEDLLARGLDAAVLSPGRFASAD